MAFSAVNNINFYSQGNGKGFMLTGSDLQNMEDWGWRSNLKHVDHLTI